MSDPKQETLRELLASLDKASKVESKNADSAIARMAARICAERLAPIVERLERLQPTFADWKELAKNVLDRYKEDPREAAAEFHFKSFYEDLIRVADEIEREILDRKE